MLDSGREALTNAAVSPPLLQHVDPGARRRPEGHPRPARPGAGADLVHPFRGPDAGLEAAAVRQNCGRARRQGRRRGHLRGIRGDHRRRRRPAADNRPRQAGEPLSPSPPRLLVPAPAHAPLLTGTTIFGWVADGDDLRDVGHRAVVARGAGGAERRRDHEDDGPQLHVGEAGGGHRRGREEDIGQRLRDRPAAHQEQPRGHGQDRGGAHREGDPVGGRVPGDPVGVRGDPRGEPGSLGRPGRRPCIILLLSPLGAAGSSPTKM